jgi:hypothetical protein
MSTAAGADAFAFLDRSDNWLCPQISLTLRVFAKVKTDRSNKGYFIHPWWKIPYLS